MLPAAENVADDAVDSDAWDGFRLHVEQSHFIKNPCMSHMYIIYVYNSRYT